MPESGWQNSTRTFYERVGNPLQMGRCEAQLHSMIIYCRSWPLQGCTQWWETVKWGNFSQRENLKAQLGLGGHCGKWMTHLDFLSSVQGCDPSRDMWIGWNCRAEPCAQFLIHLFPRVAFFVSVDDEWAKTLHIEWGDCPPKSENVIFWAKDQAVSLRFPKYLMLY
jgi:hypothetical protein